MGFLDKYMNIVENNCIIIILCQKNFFLIASGYNFELEEN
jgi:hypothetical protein